MEFSEFLKFVRNGQEERIELTVIDKSGKHLSYGKLALSNGKWKLINKLNHVNRVTGIEDFEYVPSNLSYLSMCEVFSINISDGVLKASVFAF